MIAPGERKRKSVPAPVAAGAGYFDRMPGMDFCKARERTSLRLAVVASLLLHAAVLFIGISSSEPPSGISDDSGRVDDSPRAARLQATLARPPAAPAQRPVATEKPTRKPATSPRQQKLTSPEGVWAARSWSAAERA